MDAALAGKQTGAASRRSCVYLDLALPSQACLAQGLLRPHRARQILTVDITFLRKLWLVRQKFSSNLCLSFSFLSSRRTRFPPPALTMAWDGRGLARRRQVEGVRCENVWRWSAWLAPTRVRQIHKNSFLPGAGVDVAVTRFCRRAGLLFDLKFGDIFSSPLEQSQPLLTIFIILFTIQKLKILNDMLEAAAYPHTSQLVKCAELM